MGFFDFLDARKSLAAWAAGIFQTKKRANPGHSDREIIDFALNARYETFSLSPDQSEILYKQRSHAKDIFSMCHLIAEIELLSHLNEFDRITLERKGENIITHTYRVIDDELRRRGF